MQEPEVGAEQMGREDKLVVQLKRVTELLWCRSRALGVVAAFRHNLEGNLVSSSKEGLWGVRLR